MAFRHVVEPSGPCGQLFPSTKWSVQGGVCCGLTREHSLPPPTAAAAAAAATLLLGSLARHLPPLLLPHANALCCHAALQSDPAHARDAIRYLEATNNPNATCISGCSVAMHGRAAAQRNTKRCN